MSSEDFSKMVLQRKKDKVVEVVFRVCDIEKIPIPTLNFKGCPEEDENQLAHYHPDQNKICISEFQLRKLNMEDVGKTTIHELTHFFSYEHGSKFERKNAEMQSKSWRPPRGVIYATSESIRQPLDKGRPKRRAIRKTICNYRLCKNRKGLSQCQYCKGYFCKDHYEPLIATTPYYMQHVLDPKDYKKWKKYNDDWVKDYGHPCVQYASWWNEEGRYVEDSGQAAEPDKIITGNSLSDKEQETITKKAYENYQTGFGDEVKSSKKPGLLQRIKDFLGMQ